ncbi:MAG: hypothetical protein QM582_01230 [Micropruina sp.]|uniref:hypothetical protein n=1 Tax=Micropruina sp. TaxID=2737536 RepID=UPI0039E40634
MDGRVIRKLVILACALATLTACVSPRPSRSPEPAPPSTAGIGQEVLPSATPIDWATYADHLVTVTVESERRLPISEDEREAGEGSIARELTMTVTDVPWSRPGTSTAAPKTLTWPELGWTFDREGERPLRMSGVPWVEVGRNYLIPVTFIPKGDGDALMDMWIPLGLQNQLPFQDQVIGKGEEIPLGNGEIYAGKTRGTVSTVRDRAWGKGSSDLVELLRTTAPDPRARMSLPPLSRYAETQK